MSAIFIVGNQQFKVKVGDVIYTEKITAEVGKMVSFDKVLMLDDNFGKPFLPNAKVDCEVVKHGKQPKIRIIKIISQKHHLKKQGHRQKYTKLLVKNISK